MFYSIFPSFYFVKNNSALIRWGSWKVPKYLQKYFNFKKNILLKKRTVITFIVMGHRPNKICQLNQTPPGNHCASHRAFCAKKLTMCGIGWSDIWKTKRVLLMLRQILKAQIIKFIFLKSRFRVLQGFFFKKVSIFSLKKKGGFVKKIIFLRSSDFLKEII